jgi:hypothetical protein
MSKYTTPVAFYHSVQQLIGTQHERLKAFYTVYPDAQVKILDFEEFQLKLEEQLFTASLTYGLLRTVLNPVLNHTNSSKSGSIDQHSDKIFCFYRELANSEDKLATKQSLNDFLHHLTIVSPILQPTSSSLKLWKNVLNSPKTADRMLQEAYNEHLKSFGRGKDAEYQLLTQYQTNLNQECTTHMTRAEVRAVNSVADFEEGLP